MVDKALFTSDSEEWETPQELFDQLNKEFNFRVDVCATPENAKCKKYYTKEENALNKTWSFYGTCWMNPPYGRNIGLWIEKAYKESLQGADVVCLLPARTDTKYFHRFIWDKDKHKPRKNVEVRFLEGRLKFGGSKNSAPFPSMIVIFYGVIPF